MGEVSSLAYKNSITSVGSNGSGANAIKKFTPSLGIPNLGV